MKNMQKYISMLGLMLFSLSVQAGQWLIDPELSKLSFISTKKVNIAEVHHFGNISGGLSAGQFSMEIDLASVDTGIEIRDSRMREFLFNVVDFPSATLTADIDPVFVAGLQVAQSATLTVDGSLDLHGHTQALTFDVMVTRLSADELLVVSASPVVLNVGDYGLVQGVDKLRELAGLSDISHAVPVSFYLTLNASN